MKILKYILLLTVGVIIASCGNDDDVKKGDDPEEITFSFSDRQTIVEIPEALTKVQDPYASLAVTYLSLMNSFSGYTHYFNFPEGTPVSSERIVGANARTSASKYYVYTWGNSQQGYYAYQICDHGSYYSFETFIKNAEQNDWLALIYGEELKDQSKGHFKIYDIYGENASFVGLRYDWERTGDIVEFTYTSSTFETNILLNERTKAGYVHYFEDGIKFMEINWTATGAGTWKKFTAQGEVEESGSWESPS
jgi:hypothetical protein